MTDGAKAPEGEGASDATPAPKPAERRRTTGQRMPTTRLVWKGRPFWMAPYPLVSIELPLGTTAWALLVRAARESVFPDGSRRPGIFASIHYLELRGYAGLDGTTRNALLARVERELRTVTEIVDDAERELEGAAATVGVDRAEALSRVVRRDRTPRTIYIATPSARRIVDVVARFDEILSLYAFASTIATVPASQWIASQEMCKERIFGLKYRLSDITIRAVLAMRRRMSEGRRARADAQRRIQQIQGEAGSERSLGAPVQAPEPPADSLTLADFGVSEDEPGTEAGDAHGEGGV